MRFANTIMFGLSALASLVIAQNIAITSNPGTIAAGNTLNIDWIGDKPVTLTLRYGDADNLDDSVVIGSNLVGNSYPWTVPADIANRNDYTIAISAPGEITNYSPRFSVTGGSGVNKTVDEDKEETISTMESSTMEIPTMHSSTMESSTTMTTESHSSMTTTMMESSTVTPVMNSTMTSSTTARNNSTMTSATLSTSKTADSTSRLPTATPITSSPNSASGLSSPMALVLCAVAAMIYLN